MADYDIAQAFAEIENELIDSMMRNFSRHRAEETEQGYNWTQWQAEQLKALEDYKKNNRNKFGKEFDSLNQKIRETIQEYRRKGNADQEYEILQAIKRGYKLPHGSNKPAFTGTKATAEFFKLNDRKLEALIKSTTNDLKKAETAVLRMSEDKYRKAIFNAQVYANTGAATYEKAVDMACRDMLRAGLNCVEYKNGARHTLSNYAEMAIRTANKRAYLRGEGERRQARGISTVVVNRRRGGCSHCAKYVGKVYIDDVYSGGKASDGDYPLLSEAIEDGLFHPNCKDSTSTYYEGITTLKPVSDDELKELDRRRKLEEHKNYYDNQAEKNQRIADYSLDSDNKRAYAKRAEVWQEKAEQTAEKLDETVAKSSKNDKIQPSEAFQELEKYAKAVKVEYREVQPLDKKLSISEIVKMVGGGDMTKGSCSSLALAYIGNRGGYKVLDFRGGESLNTFSRIGHIKKIASLNGVKGRVVDSINDFKAVNTLLADVVKDKEYYLATGKHVAIIRKTDNGFEYLELQSSQNNGFKKLTTSELSKRFACKKSHTLYGMKVEKSNILIDADSLAESEEFRTLLGYINTAEDAQRKGAAGYEK